MNCKLLVLCSLALVVACGGPAGETPDAGVQRVIDAGPTADAGDGVDAGPGNDGDHFLAGMTKLGVAGRFQVRLVSSNPIPEFTGVYDWTIEVLDAEGNPVAGATVVAEPRMPEHGHGTHPATTPATPVVGSEQLLLQAMDLFMPGTWVVTLNVTVGELSDHLTFAFALEG